jgi:hypothetical protein
MEFLVGKMYEYVGVAHVLAFTDVQPITVVAEIKPNDRFVVIEYHGVKPVGEFVAVIGPEAISLEAHRLHRMRILTPAGMVGLFSFWASELTLVETG